MIGSIIIYFSLFIVCAPVLGRPNFHSGEHPFPFCSRECWKGSPPTDTRPITKPVPYVVIHHTAIPGACNTSSQCMQDMRSMQNYHNSMGWGDIGYHFCVGSEGVAYQGRGWNVIGIHAIQANNYSIGICLIGDWRYEAPPAVQLATTKALIKEGVRQGVLSPTYKVIGHNQVMATECPGTALYQHISTWDNFQPGTVDFTKYFDKIKKT
ncbi:hypothetical protein O3G_MSEX004624 [Manduca sexta]|uniref:Peptidoglycan-recognition protein n=1 Tax=Manduca sexta TaxID=7130 RepID=A0A921YVL5_MANSE|nr:hypothetical protein O3G_MSEX004624 [Manduca sexta]KAG6446807.1 hypothetical protein O3G_MSEX004624 [Manduca sexta]